MGFPAQLDETDTHYPHAKSAQSIHHSNEVFLIMVMAILVIAFFLAMGLMFVHPSGSLVIFFGGLAFAGVASVVEGFFRRAENGALRREKNGRQSHAE